MTNTKSTKRALLVSVMAMVICFTMLLGTTFAWFTDSETSTNNIIVSGNLDVKFEYYDGDSWEVIESDTELFNNDALWEPGYTEVVYVKVTNIGSLALTSQVGINIVGTEITSTSVKNTPLVLSEHIQYGVKDLTNTFSKYDTAEAAISALGTNHAALSNIKTTAYASEKCELDVNEVNYYAIVVYMPTSVGNEANYDKNGGAVQPKIVLGINVVATQMAKESDHYNDQYDAGAKDDELVAPNHP